MNSIWFSAGRILLIVAIGDILLQAGGIIPRYPANPNLDIESLLASIACLLVGIGTRVLDSE